MISTKQRATTNEKFKCVDMDFITGLYQDEQGRLWVVIKAAEINHDLIDCDYCLQEYGEGMMCVDNREKMCFSCFNHIHEMNADA